MSAPRDERPLAVRLKSKKKRTVSQKRWLERQLNDPYVARARREGMRSRAASPSSPTHRYCSAASTGSSTSTSVVSAVSREGRVTRRSVPRGNGR